MEHSIQRTRLLYCAVLSVVLLTACGGDTATPTDKTLAHTIVVSGTPVNESLAAKRDAQAVGQTSLQSQRMRQQVAQAMDGISSNLLTNPGFESSGGWSATADVLSTSSERAHAGNGYAWMGGYQNAVDSLSQDVQIPGAATQAYLQFWYRIGTDETTSVVPYDKMSVDVLSVPGGSKLVTLAQFSNLDRTSAWNQSSQYDLSAYKGQTVRIKFSATTDDLKITSFLIDDVVAFANASATPAGSASFSGNRTNYTITKTGAGYNVTANTGTGGTTTVGNVQSIKFLDVSINLSIGDKSSTLSAADLQSLIELYVAFFNRVPDADGLSYWIDQFNAGQTFSEIAQNFYNAAVQYSSLTGYFATMSNADFVTIVYKNVLGRSTPDQEGLNYWVAALANGTETRGSLVKSILSSAHTFKGDATFGYVADLLDNKVTIAKYFAVQQGLNYNTPEDSISKGMAIAAAVTATGIANAYEMIGIADTSFNLAQPSTYGLTVSTVGGGTVSASPAGPNYSSGTVVTLIATPSSGSTFSGWSGACSGTGSCTVTMSSNKAVIATFATSTSTEAPASCFTTTGNICMSVSSATVSCVAIPPGFEANCSGTVLMNITSKITSGLIQIRLLVSGTDTIDNTITILPNTAPGVMNVQLLQKKVGAGACGGSANLTVYDGPSSLTGGRTLFAGGVPTAWSCR